MGSAAWPGDNINDGGRGWDCGRTLPTWPVLAIKAEAYQLVRHGIYSKIRNPIYVFGTLLVAGFVLVIRRPTLWLVVPIVIVVQTLRARREARVLETAFGDAYREYRSKTWF